MFLKQFDVQEIKETDKNSKTKKNNSETLDRRQISLTFDIWHLINWLKLVVSVLSNQYRFAYCSITHRIYSCLLIFPFGVLFDMQYLCSQKCQNSILFSSADCFCCLGQTHSFICRPYAAEYGMILIRKYRIVGSMFTAIMHTVVLG